MRKYTKSVFVLSTIVFTVYFHDVNAFAENCEAGTYERDYLSRVLDSEEGLEGATANCVCPDADGFLWFGGYTGLYRYDGDEFKKYLIEDRTFPVNEIVQDGSGSLWIGTNGEGVYKFDGSVFTECILNVDTCGASMINKLYLDSDGIVWAGTKAGLFSIDTAQEDAVTEYKNFSDTIIRDIAETSSGEMVIIQKTGEVSLLKGETVRTLDLDLAAEEGMPRCCSTGKNGSFYIGTTENVILRLSDSGAVTERVKSDQLSSFNRISELSGNTFWVCSDVGIGLLSDGKISAVKTPIDDSVEDTCQDYQGNYWFVSSRQGILQLYKNHFSNLSNYWRLTKTVNSIQPYQRKIYVGCEDGLYCFYGKDRVEDRLTVACNQNRIRQIYLDREGNLWVSTYQDGIRVMYADGSVESYNTANSGLETNQIRCIWQRADKTLLIGTEEGLYVRGQEGTIRKFIEDPILNTERILDVKEDSRGTVYVATDGYGVYEVRDGEVAEVYNKKNGMLSNIAMKLVPSERMEGIWIVTGEGICFVDRQGNVREVTGIPVSNSRDLLIDKDQAVILAGNGFFKTKEKDLLKEDVSYSWLNQSDGLPVDFTANAGNSIKDGILYLCGTTGATSIDLNDRTGEKSVRLYINEFTEDGEPVGQNSVDEKYVVSSGAHRIDLDVRMINFVYQTMYAGYYLDGMDQGETKVTNLRSDISYTNLNGGEYTYTYRLYDGELGKCIAQMSVSFVKKYQFWEEPRVRVLLAFLLVGLLALLFILLVSLREKSVKRRCYLEFLQEKEAEISELAYKDLVTGVYNRNYFEHEKDRIDLTKMSALLSVSINHTEYFKGKYGIFFMENILRKGVKILQDCTPEKLKICRVSESIFYFWFMQPVQMETYIQDIKTAFRREGEKENIPYSFSVGAIYNNTVGKENIDELIDRCGKMRLLDEKHAEAKFVEGKLKML